MSKLKGIFAQIRRAAASKVESRQSKLQKREALPPAAVLARGHGPRGQVKVAGVKAGIGAGLSEKRVVNKKSQAVHSEISEKSQKLREKFAKIKAEIDAKFEFVDAKLKTFFSRLQKEFESKFGTKF